MRGFAAMCCVLYLASTDAVAQQHHNCTGPQVGKWKLSHSESEERTALEVARLAPELLCEIVSCEQTQPVHG